MLLCCRSTLSLPPVPPSPNFSALVSTPKLERSKHLNGDWESRAKGVGHLGLIDDDHDFFGTYFNLKMNLRELVSNCAPTIDHFLTEKSSTASFDHVKIRVNLSAPSIATSRSGWVSSVARGCRSSLPESIVMIVFLYRLSLGIRIHACNLFLCSYGSRNGDNVLDLAGFPELTKPSRMKNVR